MYFLKAQNRLIRIWREHYISIKDEVSDACIAYSHAYLEILLADKKEFDRPDNQSFVSDDCGI